jgi:P-type Cu+ transporter
MATDPICGMYVDERDAQLRITRGNRTYYFCSRTCLEQFARPERELTRLRHRLLVAWPLSLAVVVLSDLLRVPAWPTIAFVLASGVQFYAGLPFYGGTRDAIRSRVWNMDVLIAVGTTLAYGYSAAALVDGALPHVFYFDASSLIVTLILSGNYLELRVREHARGAQRRLAELLPPTALVLRGDHEAEVPVDEIQVHDRVRVRPGARFPADGRVREGRSSVNESLLSGEAMPVAKAPGDAVTGGAINGEGFLTVEVTHVGSDTFLAQVGQLVSEAESGRVPLQRLADRIASLFVPFVLVVASVGSVAWFVLGGVGGPVALLVFVSVVITACPCAFGIATPAALVVGTGRAAEEGVLFKGGTSLEAASAIDVVLTDKTGTLTTGIPVVSEVIPAPGTTESELLALAAGIESGSEHPLARATRATAAQAGAGPLPVSDVTADPGHGVAARAGGVPVSVIAGTFAAQTGIRLGSLAARAGVLTERGVTWSVVTRDSQGIGLLGFHDPVAPHAAEAIALLQATGIPVVMVTGDHETAARALGRSVGITEIHAGMSPTQKLALIRQFQADGHRVAYVGDGINDAPSLVQADLGIAMGTGADVAREAGGVVLVQPDFRGVALALTIGQRTVAKVRGNLAWALGYNAVLLPIALGALVPIAGLGLFRVLPVVGALAMAISSTLVVLNSYSLRWVALDPGARRVRSDAAAATAIP